MFRHTLPAIATITILASVVGCGRSVDDSQPKPEFAEKVIRIEVTEAGFTPSNIELMPDVPAVLEFVRTAEETCATAVVFPESGILHELPLNEPVRVTVRPLSGHQIAFACPMKMLTGIIDVSGGDDR